VAGGRARRRSTDPLQPPVRVIIEGPHCAIVPRRTRANRVFRSSAAGLLWRGSVMGRVTHLGIDGGAGPRQRGDFIRVWRLYGVSYSVERCLPSDFGAEAQRSTSLNTPRPVRGRIGLDTCPRGEQRLRRAASERAKPPGWSRVPCR